MHQVLKSFFTQRDTIEPSENLLDSIFLRLKNEQQKIILKRKIFFASASLLVSFGALIPALHSVWLNFSATGFFNFFSLIFSDFSSVMSLGKTYLYSLLETLPVVPLILTLMVSLVFLEILKYLVKNITLNSKIKFLNHQN